MAGQGSGDQGAADLAKARTEWIEWYLQLVACFMLNGKSLLRLFLVIESYRVCG